MIASGLIAHIAILSIVKDPIAGTSLMLIENYLDIHLHHWIDVFALDVAMVIMIIGVIRRINSRGIFDE
ncbi:hypothetical protein R4Z10_13105 [Niallia sp. XMNu-256]|uniref:hypothetical protein n=1 Tax=Niallia sp. XMNu-256 TaxID=3082444 RepID=UPI0030CB3009